MREAARRKVLVAATAIAAGLAMLGSGCGDDAEDSALDSGERMLVGFADSSAAYPYPGSPSAERLARLEAAGGGEVGRLTIRWETVEPQPPEAGEDPSYDWDAVSPVIEALASEGIAPLPVLLGAPRWARDRSPACRRSDAICPPAEARIDEFARFSAAAAEQFADQGLAGIEIWNEPNLAAFWESAEGPDPARYAALFAAAHRALREQDPELRVLIGGLAYPREGGDGGDIELEPFLDAFYGSLDSGVLDDSTVLSFHPYPAVGVNGLDALQGAIDEALAVTARHDPDRELWATEVGLSTTDPRGPSPPSEEQQAETIVAALGHLEGVDAVKVALVYTVVDRPRSQAAIGQAGYGIVGRGPAFEPKLAYCAIVEAREMPRPRGC